MANYVLHTFALTFLIAAIALWFVGIETKGKTLEEITGGMMPVRASCVLGELAPHAPLSAGLATRRH